MYKSYIDNKTFDEMTHLGRKFGRYCPDSSVDIVNMLTTGVCFALACRALCCVQLEGRRHCRSSS